MPLVTVVVPAFNPGAFLDRSVGSVLAQTVEDLECVVVDDGSRESLATSPVLRDRRVTFHRQENRGVSVARNVGVSLGRAPYVAFLDQDDEWLPTKLEQQLGLLDAHPEASFAYAPFWWVLPSGPRASDGAPVSYVSSLAGRTYCSLSSVLVERWRHDAVGGHDPMLAQQQDWDFLLKLMAVFGDPVAAAERLVRYYVHDANASADYAAAEREARLVYEAHEVRARMRGDHLALNAIETGRRTTRRVHGHQAVDRARESARAGDMEVAFRHLRAGLSLDACVVARSGVETLRSRLGRADA